MTEKKKKKKKKKKFLGSPGFVTAPEGFNAPDF
jgi:hypothetical protein